METALIARLRRINRWIALTLGAGLLGCAAFVLADIILRQWGRSFGGTEEIAGYAMALTTSWGMSYALLELGHVRIDLLRARTGQYMRSVFDVFALAVMSAVVVTIAIKAWPVVARSIKNSSTANTPLETPLAWVQIPWFVGWVWFALMACLVTFAALSLLVKKRPQEIERFAGVFAEQDELKKSEPS